MRSLRSVLALLLAAGLAGCAYDGGGGGYGYQQANAYPGYGYSPGPSIGLGFGSNNYGGYPAYYNPNYPYWHPPGNWHRPPPGGYPGNGHYPPPGNGHGQLPPNAGDGHHGKPIFGGKPGTPPGNGGSVAAGGNRPPLRPHAVNPLCKDAVAACNS
jgi:hypothetical protein